MEDEKDYSLLLMVGFPASHTAWLGFCIFPEGGLSTDSLPSDAGDVRDRWFLILVTVSVCHCNSLVSELVLVFLIVSYAVWNFSNSFEFWNFYPYFSVHALQLHVSKGMFTALSFQLCFAKLTGAALIASSVALFLVTVNASIMENSFCSSSLSYIDVKLSESLNYGFTDYLPQKIFQF